MKFIFRFFRHITTTHWLSRRCFSQKVLKRIENAIAHSEKSHAGQIQFIIESALPTRALLARQTGKERALEVFSTFRVWDTEHNNGVLIYLLLADKDIEIVADRGIHSKVGKDYWEKICQSMEKHLKQGRYEAGVMAGIQLIDEALKTHFPQNTENKNELLDRPIVI
jgi:uncharacterized membrane protein